MKEKKEEVKMNRNSLVMKFDLFT